MNVIRKLLAAKIHRAIVTESDLDYEGSITLPPPLMKAAGLIPFESVLIWDITSGNRFETYAIIGDDDRTICINGAAAHLAKPGDLIIVSRFIWLEEKECADHRPNIVLVDTQNKITSIEHKQQ